MEPSWNKIKREADWQHPFQTADQCMSFEKTVARPDITKKYYTAHPERFVRS